MENIYEMKGNFADPFKKRKDDKIWWISDIDYIGNHLFTFDRITVFNLGEDYPHNLTAEQKEIFDKENPYLASLFTYED